MALKVEGKIEHFVSSNGISFEFRKINEKRSKKEDVDVFEFSTFDIPFEIWQRFKGNKVRITIDKIK